MFLTGCGELRAAAPPAQSPTTTVPTLSVAVGAAEASTLPALRRHSFRRAASEMTVRVRNATCQGVYLGSGFALTSSVLVTNRHVVAGADALDVDTWDGHTMAVDAAYVGVLGDIGLVSVSGRLPRVAKVGRDAAAGDVVTVVGYPLGGELTLSSGVVVDTVDGRRFGIPGTVMRLTARVEHGNSGGPVLDVRGHVVGIVFAIETATGFGLAIPAEALKSLVTAGGLEEVPACGSN
jgi:S1-C subfamily serine protease